MCQIFISVVLTAVILTSWWPMVGCASDSHASVKSSITVRLDGQGVGVVHASVILPEPRELVFAVLTDYPHWPDLFPRQPQINAITQKDDRTIVDMLIPAIFIPLKLELVTSTKAFAPDRVETQFVRGDFSTYEWVWALRPNGDATNTEAVLELKVKPTIWVPGWVLTWLIETELRKHLELLQRQVQARGTSVKSKAALEARP